MRITHCLDNAFLIENGNAKVAVDPGQNLWMFKLRSLIPESEWPSVTHIVITHGDRDHHWQSVSLDGVPVEAVKTVHGPIAAPILGATYRAQPGPGERVGIGAMGFRITIGDTSFVNLGDTVLVPEWEDVCEDVLMLPIGGLGRHTWTMDIDEALEAVLKQRDWASNARS